MSTESHAIQQAAAEFIRDRHLLGAFVTGLLRDVHAAEDVLQEVWMLLSAELEKGTRIQNQAAWCRGVARLLELVDGSFEEQSQDMPSGFPQKFGFWSGKEAKQVTVDEVNGERFLRFVDIEDVPDLPRVLLIGDSISIGYTLDVREMLKDRANVHRIPVNGGPTTNGLQNIQKWLGDSKWDIIHFNFGLHDLKYMRTVGTKGNPSKTAGAKAQVPLDEYEKNLAELVKIMQATGAQLIWRTTTPHPADPDGRVAKYNEAAARVMKAAGIPTDDLNAHATAKPDAQLPSNVHYSPKGYHYLAEKVAAAITEYLPKK